MQTRRLLIVGAVIAASVAMAAQDGITLRKTLTTGTETYHMESTVKQTISLPGGNDQDMGIKSASTYTYKIGSVDATAGQAPVEVTTKIDKMDFDGPMADMINGQKEKLQAPITITGKIDARNHFTGDPKQKIDPRTVIFGPATSSILTPFIEFPEKPVNPGDTWDVTIPKGPITSNEDQKLTAKFVGEKVVDGTSVNVLSLSGTIKMNINIGELMKANPVPELEALGAVDMTITGTMDMAGEANVDKTTGQTLSMTLKLTVKQEMAIAALGDSKIPGSSVTDVKFTLVK